MKKKWIPAIVIGVVVLCGSVAYAVGGTASDPLVSLDYITNTYLPSLLEKIQTQVDRSVSTSYEKIAAKVQGSSGSRDEKVAITSHSCSRGDTITLKEGSVVVLSAGSVAASVSDGQIIDATSGTASVQLSLSSGHRYLVGEGATAVVTVNSDAALAMLEGNYTTKSAGQKVTSFTDLVSTDWYYSYVIDTYKKGLLTGTSDTTFAPKASVTRAMLATVLYRLAGQPSGAVELVSFEDVPVGTWYTVPVSWAASAEVVHGVGNGLFAPNSKVTREQMAVMLYNYTTDYQGKSGERTGDLDQFRDGTLVSPWAKEGLSWAVGTGIINGRENGNLDPTGTATRAEVCAMLQRFTK